MSCVSAHAYVAERLPVENRNSNFAVVLDTGIYISQRSHTI